MCGLSIGEIQKRGNWSNECTWQKIYNKSIEGDRFEEAVLKGTL